MTAARSALKSATLKIPHMRAGAYAIGSLANMGPQVWLAQSAERSAGDLIQAFQVLMAENPEGVSGLLWLKHGTDLPTASARKLFIGFLRKHGSESRQVALVLEGAAGFWASVVPGMLTSIRIASGNKVGFRVAASVDGALAWLPAAHRTKTGVSLSGLEIRKTQQAPVRG